MNYAKQYFARFELRSFQGGYLSLQLPLGPSQYKDGLSGQGDYHYKHKMVDIGDYFNDKTVFYIETAPWFHVTTVSWAE